MATDSTSYDELPYETTSIPAADPVALSFSSWLHGGPRPPVRGFRLIELGCGDGSNLIPLAFYHRDARFQGVDDSHSAVSAGRGDAESMGLDNLCFRELDLAELEIGDESFDYVVAHGVFSWVDADRRRRILELCRSALSPRGLAFVSYNTQPGWKIRGVVRDLLRSCVLQEPDPVAKVAQAREIAKGLRSLLGGSGDPYQELLAREFDRLEGRGDSYVFHEYLCHDNHAFFHREFMQQARACGLHYVCDALHNRPEGRVPDDLRKSLEGQGHLGDAMEEVVDILCFRQFRTALLCREDAPRETASQDVASTWESDGLIVQSSALPDAAVEPDLEAPQWFRRDDGGVSFSVCNPALRVALTTLAECRPAALPLESLCSEVAEALEDAGLDTGASRAGLVDELIGLYREGIVQVRPGSPPAACEGRRGRTPHALARLEARKGTTLTTPLHGTLSFLDFDREVIRAFQGGRDGIRDVEAVIHDCSRRVASGELSLASHHQTTSVEERPLSVRKAVEACLDRAAEWGLTTGA